MFTYHEESYNPKQIAGFGGLKLMLPSLLLAELHTNDPKKCAVQGCLETLLSNLFHGPTFSSQ